MRPLPRPSWMVAYMSRIPPFVASIREHPAGVSPTLESIPKLHNSKHDLASIIRAMQETGYQRWGFVIYRCAYADELQWASYLEFMKAAVEDNLKYYEVFDLLWPYLEWTIIEDQESLDGVSKKEVRNRFSQWVADSMDGTDPDGLTPRFDYCVSIDQDCLDTVTAYEEWVAAGAEGLEKLVICAVLDVDCEEGGLGEQGYPSVEGCTREYAGWIYASVWNIPSVYDDLCRQARLMEGMRENEDFDRPPGIYPTAGRESMPLRP